MPPSDGGSIDGPIRFVNGGSNHRRRREDKSGVTAPRPPKGAHGALVGTIRGTDSTKNAPLAAILEPDPTAGLAPGMRKSS